MIIKLKNADFSKNNIGTLSTWTITRVLGNGATYNGVAYVNKDAALNVTINIAEGYELGANGVTVTMGGEAVTSGISVDGNIITISIASVTGNVVIKVPTLNISTGEEEEPDTPEEPKDFINATNLVQTVLTINNTGIGATTAEFNQKPYVKGEPYSATTMHCSDFIPVKKDDVIIYKLRGAGAWAAVLAFYTSNDVSSVVDTVPSVSAEADVTGQYVCPNDGYIRIANRQDHTAGCVYINGMPANNMANTNLTITGNGIGTGVSTPGGSPTVKGELYSAATMKCSDFIPVKANDVINYRLRGAGAWAGVLAFYTSNNASSVVEVIPSVSAEADVVGQFTCPSNGYIKIASRQDYPAAYLVINA